MGLNILDFFIWTGVGFLFIIYTKDGMECYSYIRCGRCRTRYKPREIEERNEERNDNEPDVVMKEVQMEIDNEIDDNINNNMTNSIHDNNETIDLLEDNDDPLP